MKAILRAFLLLVGVAIVGGGVAAYAIANFPTTPAANATIRIACGRC